MRLAARFALIAGVLAAGSSACSHGPEAPTREIIAPYPYSESEMRAGLNFGRSIEYMVQNESGAYELQRWVYRPVDSNRVEITTQEFDDEGNPVGQPSVETATYTELYQHNRFPQRETVIDDATVDLSAGTFESKHYVVTDGDTVKNFWFAKGLAGPPVKMTITKGGKQIYSMAMRANRTHTDVR